MHTLLVYISVLHIWFGPQPVSLHDRAMTRECVASPQDCTCDPLWI